LDIGIPRDTVQRCIQETLLFLSYSLAKKQAVDFIFKDIGRLVSRKSRVQMHFSSDFVHNLNSNGQLLKCRLTVSFSLHQHSPGLLGNAPRGRWRVRKQLGKRKEALQEGRTKSRAVDIPGKTVEELPLW